MTESKDQGESLNPLRNESEDRDPGSGEPEVWKGRFDDNGEFAKGGVSGTALTRPEDEKNPFEDDTDEDAADRP